VDTSSESLAGECGQNECSLVNFLAVVPAQLLLLLGRPASERLLEVAVGILTAYHEADLSGWIGRDGGVAILNVGEDLLASLLEVGNEWHVQPLVLSYTGKQVSRGVNKHLYVHSGICKANAVFDS
jgi:hypothetical protein